MPKYCLSFVQRVVVNGIVAYVRNSKYRFFSLHEAIHFVQSFNSDCWCVYFDYPEYRLVARSQYE